MLQFAERQPRGYGLRPLAADLPACLGKRFFEIATLRNDVGLWSLLGRYSRPKKRPTRRFGGRGGTPNARSCNIFGVGNVSAMK